MRLSDLLGADVLDADGTPVGRVTDVRMTQDGPVLGTWGAAFRVTGLVVSPRHTGSYLGYDRRTVRGPWLVAKAVRWLHRDAVLVPWDDVVSCDGGRVVLASRRSDLPRVPTLA